MAFPASRMHRYGITSLMSASSMLRSPRDPMIGKVPQPGRLRMRIVTVTLGLIALVLAAAAELPAQATGPIKIGFVSPLSGAIAAAGKDMYSGCELYWQETGFQL